MGILGSMTIRRHSQTLVLETEVISPARAANSVKNGVMAPAPSIPFLSLFKGGNSKQTKASGMQQGSLESGWASCLPSIPKEGQTHRV